MRDNGEGKLMRSTNRTSISTILKKYNLALLLLVFVIVSSILSPRFLTFQNFFNILQQSAIVGIVAVGMTFVALTGGIDLSVGSNVALAGMVVSILFKNQGWGLLPAIAVTLLIGSAVGFTTGSIITRFRLPDFITSLAIMESIRGLALLLTNGKPIFGLDGDFRFLGSGFIFDAIPVSGVVWILITAIAFVFLKFIPMGRSFYAIGGNTSAAFLSGIRIKFNKSMAYMFSGLLSAFGGIMLASWLSTGQPNAGIGMELDAIASSVIGGTSLSGGIGGVVGTLGGVFLLTIITNILNLVGVPSYFQQIFKGLIILIALIGNNLVTDKGK
jgi:ribose transport system permease protein